MATTPMDFEVYDKGTGDIHQTLPNQSGFLDSVANDDEVAINFNDMNSRCSVRNVHDVIASFDEVKCLMVKSIGFGGLLKFPSLSHLNRKFASWLMTKVEETSQRIVIDSCRSFPFTKEDVHLVFGIPAAGKRVALLDGGQDDSRVQFVRRCLGLEGKDARCITAAQDILVRDYNNPMHAVEEDSFKVAFVIFIMATLLTPSSKHDYSNIEFWHALGKPSDIGTYDWSSYVIHRLLIASAKLKSDINKNMRMPLLSGCTFFLQVFYLDSIDLGELNMPHNIFPRVQCFTSNRIKAMAASDACRDENGERLASVFGASMPRVGNDVCYTWARSRGNANKTTARARRMLDAATQLVSSLNIPDEAATPIFLAMMQHRRDLVDIIDEEEVALLEVIGIIANSYKKGFMYCSPVRGMKRALDAAELPRPSTMVKHVASATVGQTRQHDGIGGNNSEAGPSNTTLKLNRLQDASQTLVKNYSCEGPCGVDLTFGSKVSLDVHPIHSLRGDETHELTLPLTQVQQLDSSNYADDRTPHGRHRSSSPATANKVMSEYYLWAKKSKSLATVHFRASKDEF